jgi:hypothetical protein
MTEQPGYPSQYPPGAHPAQGSTPQDGWFDGSRGDQYGASAQADPYLPRNGAYGAAPRSDGGYGAASGGGAYGASSQDPYGQAPQDRYAASQPDQYGAAAAGQYGAQYAAPSADQYGAQYAAPSAGQYAAPAQDRYGQPAQDQYGAPPPYGQGSTTAHASRPASGASPAVGDRYGAPHAGERYGAPPPAWQAPPGQQHGQQHGQLSGQPPAGLNGFAVASLVLGAIGGFLLSVIFGFVALSQIRKRNQRGRGLAITGLVLSGLWVLAIAVVLVLAIGGVGRNDAGEITEEGSVSSFDLKPGDCINGLTETDNISSLPAVPCAQPHDGEVFATFEITAATFPGDAELKKQAETGCVQRLAEYSAAAATDDKLEIYFLHPTERSWAQGDHEVTCVAIDTNKRSGSLKD